MFHFVDWRIFTDVSENRMPPALRLNIARREGICLFLMVLKGLVLGFSETSVAILMVDMV
jgi:hypothetical protein